MCTLDGNETNEPLCMFWMRKVGYMKNTKVCEMKDVLINERAYDIPKWKFEYYSQTPTWICRDLKRWLYCSSKK